MDATYGSEPALRLAILEAALQHVPFDGWSDAALRAGARDAGADPSQLALVFPGGVADAIAAMHQAADDAMLQRLEAADLSGMKLREKVAFAIWGRLEAAAPHKEAARLACAHLALPHNLPAALTGTYRTVDAIWHGIGDRSVDFSFYTKRAMLAGVYLSTLIYWFGDRSEGHGDTRAFLDRRIADVMRFGKFTGGLKQRLAALEPVTLLRRFAMVGRSSSMRMRG